MTGIGITLGSVVRRVGGIQEMTVAELLPEIYDVEDAAHCVWHVDGKPRKLRIWLRDLVLVRNSSA